MENWGLVVAGGAGLAERLRSMRIRVRSLRRAHEPWASCGPPPPEAAARRLCEPGKPKMVRRPLFIFNFQFSIFNLPSGLRPGWLRAGCLGGFAEDTPARQNASSLAFALAYSYLCRMILKANCKINLGLDVLRRRADGFHDLETVMVPVEGLYDVVELDRKSVV